MIRFGIVGAGNIAQKFARDIEVVSNAKVVAIASRSKEKADRFKKEFDLEYAFSSYEEMANSGRIDAVYIATPHNFHKEQSILFMKHHIHVLCEKPIAVNVSELDEMILEAKKNKVLLMEAMWTAFLPATKRVLSVVKSNELGKLQTAKLAFGLDFSGIKDEEGRVYNINLAGGSLLDLGVYPVFYLLNLVKEDIEKLDAKASFYHTGVDDECSIDILFKNGLKASLVSSFKEQLSPDGILEFEKGLITAYNFWKSEEIEIQGIKEDYPHEIGGFEYEIASFSQTIEKGLLENPIMTHEKSRRTLALLDRIRKNVSLQYPFE